MCCVECLLSHTPQEFDDLYVASFCDCMATYTADPMCDMCGSMRRKLIVRICCSEAFYPTSSMDLAVVADCPLHKMRHGFTLGNLVWQCDCVGYPIYRPFWEARCNRCFRQTNSSGFAKTRPESSMSSIHFTRMDKYSDVQVQVLSAEADESLVTACWLCVS